MSERSGLGNLTVRNRSAPTAARSQARTCVSETGTSEPAGRGISGGTNGSARPAARSLIRTPASGTGRLDPRLVREASTDALAAVLVARRLAARRSAPVAGAERRSARAAAVAVGAEAVAAQPSAVVLRRAEAVAVRLSRVPEVAAIGIADGITRPQRRAPSVAYFAVLRSRSSRLPRLAPWQQGCVRSHRRSRTRRDEQSQRRPENLLGGH
jgi:hypothetical protein